jgi:hypothetical protein
MVGHVRMYGREKKCKVVGNPMHRWETIKRDPKEMGLEAKFIAFRMGTSGGAL